MADASGTQGWLSQRRAVLAILLAETALAWGGALYYLLADSPVVPSARTAYFALAPTLALLSILYWRGWDRARYAAVVVTTIAIGAVLPLPPDDYPYLPQAIIIPSALALILASPAWVVGSALGTFAIMLARTGGIAPNLGAVHVLTLAVTIASLVVSRLVIDAARREAEARADQAEHTNQILGQQAVELRRQQSSEHVHATLLAGVEQPVLATAPDGTLIYWNRGAERLFGWPADEIVGRRFADLEPPPYDLPADTAAWRERAPEVAQTRDLDGRRRDGTSIPTTVRSWPIRDVDATLLGRVAVITDLTERRAAERQRELFEQGQKLRALGQMAGGIAHDLNQALAVVTGYVELALGDLDQAPVTEDGTETREFLETAAQAAVQGADSVKRLLAFARQQDQGPPEIVDVAQVIHETVRFTAPQWRDQAQAHGRPIALDIQAESGLRVLGWATSLREALMNLVLNAVDALPSGGAIRLTARRDASTIIVEVADTGTGMPPEVRERIFEPFYTTRGEQGTGLGLAMVFGIMERHGGTIAVTSAKRAGTTFCLTFPEATGATMTVANDGPAVSTIPVRILVVDDEPRLARMLSALLARDRHDVETAPSGEAAVEKLEAGGYDLVISDLSMGPGMNGWDLAQEVARRWPDIRFVLASGWGAGIGEQETRRQAVDAVLAKPYRADELRRVVVRLTA